MRRSALALLFCCMFLALTSQIGHAIEITVDATPTDLPVNTRLFGHNTVYQNGIEGLWNGTTRTANASGGAAMLNAGTGGMRWCVPPRFLLSSASYR